MSPRRLLSLVVGGLVVAAFAVLLHAQVLQNAQQLVTPHPCQVVHRDAAVNTTVAVSTTTPGTNLTVYLCGWDFTVSQDATGGAQNNVLWTTANLNGYAVEYSAGTVASSVTSGTFMFTEPIAAQTAGIPVTFISPAAALHAAYSVNLYFYLAP